MSRPALESGLSYVSDYVMPGYRTFPGELAYDDVRDCYDFHHEKEC